MLDAALFKLIIETVRQQLVFARIPGVTLDQAYQPVRQGVNKVQPSAYVMKLFDKRDGSPSQEYIWDEDKQLETKTITQQMLTTFQITALNTPDPNNPTQYTASDIANLLAAILQSPTTVEMFRIHDVGILNITEVRNPFFSDDRDRWEASPSFDFVIAHKQTLSGTSPTITDVNFNIYPI